MKCMSVVIWVHHMQIDELFDFLNGRIDKAPPYWYSQEEVPYSVTGGYIQVTLPYNSYSDLRSGKALNTARGLNPLFDRSDIESVFAREGAVTLDNANDLHTIFER